MMDAGMTIKRHGNDGEGCWNDVMFWEGLLWVYGVCYQCCCFGDFEHDVHVLYCCACCAFD